MKNIVILISGNGSNLQAMIDAIKSNILDDVSISVVISDRKNAYGLTRAVSAGIPTLYLPFKKAIEDRNSYDERLAKHIKKYNPDYVFCLGFLHVFSKKFVVQFEKKLINLHPALPGTFTGLDCIKKQYMAMINGDIFECGVMCHYVDEGVDTGQVIAVTKIECDKTLSLEEFEMEIHKAEHSLVVSVAHNL